jgi:hypothetical protein
MAEHDGDGTYPATWPFRAAGTIVIAALSWFCLGFALEDQGRHLPAFYPIFFAGLIVAGVLILGGGLFNVRRERARTAR